MYQHAFLGLQLFEICLQNSLLKFQFQSRAQSLFLLFLEAGQKSQHYY